MVWYLGQSLIMLSASFALGLLVGWAAWRLPWRKRRFGESDVIAALNRQHTLELAERDERIARLQDELFALGMTSNDRAVNPLDARHEDAQYPDFPDAQIANDQESSLEEPALLLDDAQVEPPGPRPPALFPASGDMRATAMDERSMDKAAPDDTAPDDTAPDDTAPNDTAPEKNSPVEPAPEEPSPEEPAPEGAGAPQGMQDAVPRVEVDLRDAPAPRAQEMPSHATTDERGVADLRGDDLTRIVGISPEIAGSLQAAGLHTYQDLASARPHQVDSALQTGRAPWTDLRRTWPRQAQLLADGDETGFDRLARGLITDREITRGL
jgi:predicted flap endonuclease-1-like 5' DNA nuclease